MKSDDRSFIMLLYLICLIARSASCRCTPRRQCCASMQSHVSPQGMSEVARFHLSLSRCDDKSYTHSLLVTQDTTPVKMLLLFYARLYAESFRHYCSSSSGFFAARNLLSFDASRIPRGLPAHQVLARFESFPSGS